MKVSAAPVEDFRKFFGMASIVLVLILCASLWTTARLKHTAESAARASSAIEAATKAHKQVVGMDRLVRSYLLGGDPKGLGDRSAATDATWYWLGQIRRLLDDGHANGPGHGRVEDAVRHQIGLHDRLITQKRATSPAPSDLLGWVRELDAAQIAVHRLIDDVDMFDEREGLAECVRRARDGATLGLIVNGLIGLIGLSAVVVAAAVTARDARDKHRARQDLIDSEERFRSAYSHAPVGMAMTTALGQFVQVNPAFCALTGFSEPELMAMDFRALAHPDDAEESARAIGRLLDGSEASLVIEKRYIANGGAHIWARTSISLIPGRCGGEVLVIAQVEDVSERKLAAERLAYQASHDALTGLPNRALLFATLGAALEEAGRSGSPMAILVIDLDSFKQVNDTYGHHYGDVVLQQVSGRLRSILRPSDMVARLGGDEFAILLPGKDGRGAEGVADRASGEIGRAIEVDGLRFEIGACIGIAVYPEHAEDPDALLHRADGVMYLSKRSRTGRDLPEAGRPPCIGEVRTSAADIRRGIEAHQFLLHYQPLVELAGRVVVGVEALARWQHPDEGLLLPSRFIATAEQSGLIRRIDLWSLETALSRCAEWHEAGVGISVAVNLAAESLLSPRLVEVVAGLLEGTGVMAGSLTLEVTESMMMPDAGLASEVLGRLRAMGVRISIDDFGTGYSSLCHLRDLPVDEVKIDRGFVGEMTRDARSSHIVRSVIDLGHELGLRVVAEGVEDEASVDLLASWGCDVAQGYHFGRPLPAEEFSGLANGFRGCPVDRPGRYPVRRVDTRLRPEAPLAGTHKQSLSRRA